MGWQELIVGVCVCIAVGYTLRSFFIKPQCGGCKGCGKAQACKVKP